MMNEESVTDMPVDQYGLYAEFGIAAEKAQVLEVDAGNVLIAYLAIFVDKDKNKVTADEREMYRAIFDDLNRKTFGALVGLVKKVANLDDSMITIVDEALERRNYLSHHFFRTHNFALFSEEGRKVMVQELKDIQAKLDLAHHVLNAMSSILLEISGRGALNTLNRDMALQMQARGKRIGI
jgi:hypothetical protein